MVHGTLVRSSGYSSHRCSRWARVGRWAPAAGAPRTPATATAADRLEPPGAGEAPAAGLAAAAAAAGPPTASLSATAPRKRAAHRRRVAAGAIAKRASGCATSAVSAPRMRACPREVASSSWTSCAPRARRAPEAPATQARTCSVPTRATGDAARVSSAPAGSSATRWFGPARREFAPPPHARAYRPRQAPPAVCKATWAWRTARIRQGSATAGRTATGSASSGVPQSASPREPQRNAPAIHRHSSPRGG